MKKKSLKYKKIEEYLLNLVKEDRKETLEEMANSMNVNVNSFAVYVSRHKELKKLYDQCKLRKNGIERKSMKYKKIEEYLLNLINEGRKETLYDMSKSIGIKVNSFKSYVYKNNELRKLYDRCKVRGKRKNVSSILDKWESGKFDKIQVSNLRLTEEEELKNDIISFLEKNDYITKYDILRRFDITIGRLNSLKNRDYDFREKFNKLSCSKTYVVEEKIRKVLDSSTEKKTVKQLQAEMDGVSILHIYGFLRKNEKYNEKIFGKKIKKII